METKGTPVAGNEAGSEALKAAAAGGGVEAGGGDPAGGDLGGGVGKGGEAGKAWEAGGDGGGTGLSPGLEKLIAERVAAGVADGVKAHLDAAQTKQTASANRAAVIAKELPDVPEIYTRNMLGTDPAKFVDEAKAIRAQYQADLAKAGVKAAPLGSDSGGVPPIHLAAKSSPADLIGEGLRQAARQRPGKIEEAEEKK